MLGRSLSNTRQDAIGDPNQVVGPYSYSGLAVASAIMINTIIARKKHDINSVKRAWYPNRSSALWSFEGFGHVALILPAGTL